MRRQQHQPLAGELGQQVAKAQALGGVEPDGGLVDDQQLRIAQQRLRDAHALAHAARVAGQRAVGDVEQADLGEALVDARGDGARGRPLTAARKARNSRADSAG